MRGKNRPEGSHYGKFGADDWLGCAILIGPDSKC